MQEWIRKFAQLVLGAALIYAGIMPFISFKPRTHHNL